MTVSWYQSLIKVLLSRFPQSCRHFQSPDLGTQYLVSPLRPPPTRETQQESSSESSSLAEQAPLWRGAWRAWDCTDPRKPNEPRAASHDVVPLGQPTALPSAAPRNTLWLQILRVKLWNLISGWSWRLQPQKDLLGFQARLVSLSVALTQAASKCTQVPLQTH